MVPSASGPARTPPQDTHQLPEGGVAKSRGRRSTNGGVTKSKGRRSIKRGVAKSNGRRSTKGPDKINGASTHQKGRWQNQGGVDAPRGACQNQEGVDPPRGAWSFKFLTAEGLYAQSLGSFLFGGAVRGALRARSCLIIASCIYSKNSQNSYNSTELLSFH